MHADVEFESLKRMAEAKHNAPTTNLAAANEHVPEIKQNNRVIEERVEAECDRQPHEKLPKLSIVAIACESVKWSNTHFAKGGILTSITS